MNRLFFGVAFFFSTCLASHAQPDYIPLTLEWEFELSEEEYVCSDLNDFNNDGVPDFFMAVKNELEESWDIVRLRDNEELWRIEDYPYEPTAIKVMDADKDGEFTVWVGVFLTDLTSGILEMDVSNGSVIRENIGIDLSYCKIRQFTSLIMVDSVAYPIIGVGTGAPLVNSFRFGNILKLDPNNLTVIDQLFYSYNKGNVNFLTRDLNSSEQDEKLIYTIDYFDIFQLLGVCYYKYFGFCGVIDNSFEVQNEIYIYEQNRQQKQMSHLKHQ